MASDQQWGVKQTLQPPPQYYQSNYVDPHITACDNEGPRWQDFPATLLPKTPPRDGQQYFSLADGNEFGTSYPDVPDQKTRSEPHPVFNGWNGMNEYILAQQPVFEQNIFAEPQSSEENAQGRRRNISPSAHLSWNIQSNFEDMDPGKLKQREPKLMATLKPDASTLRMQAPTFSVARTGSVGPATELPITFNNFGTGESFGTIGGQHVSHINYRNQGQSDPIYSGINTDNIQNANINSGVRRYGTGANATTVASRSPFYHPGMAYTVRDGSEISRTVENSQYPQHTMGPDHTPVHVYTVVDFEHRHEPRNGQSEIGPPNFRKWTRTSHVQDSQPSTQRKRAQVNKANDRAFPVTLCDLNVERIYKPTTEVFVGQEPQMFDQQAMHRGGFDNMNRELLLAPEFQSAYEGSMNENLSLPPKGFYDPAFNCRKHKITQIIEPENTNSDAQNISFRDTIPAPKRANNCESSKNGLSAYLNSHKSKYPRVTITEEEIKVIDPAYENRFRRKFQGLRNSRTASKTRRIDWDQVELLNAHRRGARHNEKERRKLCSPGEYVPKFISAEYKPTKKLRKYQDSWLEAKKVGVISDT
ncbi:3030114c-40bb-4fba-a77a-532f6b5580ef [Sclerotinia trifoliorum]|uniref:3030114c-40bb-4fba-a77a-532f6b5580ef n=1 Tax=Sclerotinia trifoliorum TaxID=28548 RepID=A0A8H2W242_9HELO|nr:3030114c-40bb-4fba-a77a-532f6b5580ef [Sclerotinia trifoliorum]